jgi:hypothetical protein
MTDNSYWRLRESFTKLSSRYGCSSLVMSQCLPVASPKLQLLIYSCVRQLVAWRLQKMTECEGRTSIKVVTAAAAQFAFQTSQLTSSLHIRICSRFLRQNDALTALQHRQDQCPNTQEPPVPPWPGVRGKWRVVINLSSGCVGFGCSSCRDDSFAFHNRAARNHRTSRRMTPRRQSQSGEGALDKTEVQSSM